MDRTCGGSRRLLLRFRPRFWPIWSESMVSNTISDGGCRTAARGNSREGYLALSQQKWEGELEGGSSPWSLHVRALLRPSSALFLRPTFIRARRRRASESRESCEILMQVRSCPSRSANGLVQFTMRGVVIGSDPPQSLHRHCGARHDIPPAGVEGFVESEVPGSADMIPQEKISWRRTGPGGRECMSKDVAVAERCSRCDGSTGPVSGRRAA